MSTKSIHTKIPLTSCPSKLHKKYWSFKWLKASKGNSIKTFSFKRHYFSDLKKAENEAIKLGSYNGTYYAIFQVWNRGVKKFTFLPSNANFQISRLTDLNNLKVIKYVKSVPAGWFKI